MTVQLMSGDEVLDALETLITGDATGDGDINIFDIMAIRDHIFDKSQLSGVFGFAANINGDENINIFDIMAIRDHIFGKAAIIQR